MRKKTTVSELFLAYRTNQEILHEKVKAREALKPAERQEAAEFRKETEPFLLLIQTVGTLLSLCDEEIKLSDSQQEILAPWLPK